MMVKVKALSGRVESAVTQQTVVNANNRDSLQGERSPWMCSRSFFFVGQQALCRQRENNRYVDAAFRRDEQCR